MAWHPMLVPQNIAKLGPVVCCCGNINWPKYSVSLRCSNNIARQNMMVVSFPGGVYDMMSLTSKVVAKLRSELTTATNDMLWTKLVCSM